MSGIVGRMVWVVGTDMARIVTRLLLLARRWSGPISVVVVLGKGSPLDSSLSTAQRPRGDTSSSLRWEVVSLPRPCCFQMTLMT